MGSRTSTCKGCGATITTEERYVYSNKGYCKTCYDGVIEIRQTYIDLVTTICEYFDIEKPTSLMLKHIKDYQENLDYRYSAMKYTLWYLKFIKGYSFNPKYGIAIVKYEFDNAKEYYMQQIKIQESVIAASKVEENVREVKVNFKKQKRPSLLIDIDELIRKDGDE